MRHFPFAFSLESILLVRVLSGFSISAFFRFRLSSFLGFGFILTSYFLSTSWRFLHLYDGVFLTSSWTVLVSVRSYFYSRITLPPYLENWREFLV